MPEAPFFDNTDANALLAYLREHTGQPWRRSTIGAGLQLGAIYISVFPGVDAVRAIVGGVVVYVHHCPLHLAVPILSDPAALRTHVCEALALALASASTSALPLSHTADTEPTS